MVYFIYRHGIGLYFWIIHIAVWFRSDAKRWVMGRENNWSHIRQCITKANNNKQWIWIHCSSLGEFEQGKPLIELIKNKHPEIKICLSFYSPSGYDQKKNYAFADLVCYFPSDKVSDVKQFLDLLQPRFAIFVKYDFWWNVLHELNQRRIPVVFISSIFRKNQYLLSWWAGSFRSILSKCYHIFTQDQHSHDLIKKIIHTGVTAVGDTRIDRVLNISESQGQIPWLHEWKAHKKLFIAGSIWPADSEIIDEFIKHCNSHDWKLLLVPHEVDQNDIHQWLKLLPAKTLIYSEWLDQQQACDCLVFDKIGYLSTLYKEADAVYIGGGFGKSIHNILEPLAYGIPVSFGPKHKKFPEAKSAIEGGFGFELSNKMQVKNFFQNCQSIEFAILCKRLAIAFLNHHRGSTQKIYHYLYDQFIK